MILNIKQNLTWRWLVSVFVMLSMLVISGCGDKEPRQRSAFIIFLQTEIINKNRLNLPVLNSEQVESFGDYASHYQMLADFNNELNTAFTPLAASLQSFRAMTSVKEMVDNRDNVQETLTQINDSAAKLTELTQRIEQQKATLVQPDELNVPFDRAYNKIVTQQTESAKEGFPLLSNLFTDALALIDFVKSKGDSVRYVGSGIEFSSQEDVNTFNELNAKLQQAQHDYLSFSQQGR